LLGLAETLEAHRGFADVIAALREGHGGAIGGTWGSASALAVAAILESWTTTGTLVVVLPHATEADDFLADLALFSGVAAVLLPAIESLGEDLGEDPAAAERLAVVKRLAAPDAADTPVVVTSIQALLAPLADPRDIAAAQDRPDGVIRPGDGRNAQALSDLQRTGLIGSLDPTSASTFTEAFSEVAGTVGVQAESAKLRGNAQTALVRQLVDQQQSLSGVNLDEEAANLLRYQQAYQASAKLIAIAGSLIQSLLEI